MLEKIEGLLFLEEMSEFVYSGEDADLLTKYYELIEDPFDYFLRCIVISRRLQADHGSKKCPSEIMIIAHVLEEALGESDQAWIEHREECHACEHTFATYKFLVENIWKSLRSLKQYFLANIILAYLRKDPLEEIEKVFNGFRQAIQETEPTASWDPMFLKGILVVQEFRKDGSLEGCCYGLSRREYHVLGSSMCITAPFGGNSPIFRTDFTNEKDQFYFWLWDGIQVEGGLQFYFRLPERESVFAQSVTGVSVSKPVEKTEWRAKFYGTVN